MNFLFVIEKHLLGIRLINLIGIIELPLLLLTSSAQPQKNIQFHHFSEEHGLPGSRCETIIQDKKGYIWFGSVGDTLARFDGTSFKTFHPDPPRKDSFVASYVTDFCTDIHGNLWGIAWEGIFKYNPDTEIITEYFANSHKYVFPSGWVRCLIADEQGKVWFGTGKGLVYYDPPSDSVVNLSGIISPDTLCNRNIGSLLIDHNGLLWIGTENGINIYDPIHKKIKLFDPGDKNFSSLSKNVVCMLEDHASDIWISFHNEGIYRYNPSTGSSKFYNHSDADNNSLCSDIVTSLLEDSHHNIWVGSFGGISVYQPTTDNFQSYEADPFDKNSLSSDRVETLFEDRSGALWIGMNGGELNVCYPGAKNFFVYQNTDKKEAASAAPTDFHIDAMGRIYMTTFGGGLKEFDPATGMMNSYKVELPNTGSKANYYYGVFESSDGNIWLAGLKAGLHKFDPKNDKFTTIYSKADVSTCIAEDLDNRLWIGCNGGLNCYNMRTGTYSRSEELFGIRRINAISSLYCDREGILWISSILGLNLLNTKTGQLRNFKHDDNNPNSLVDNDVTSVYDDGKGKVWICTHGGLSEFDKHNEQFVSYTIQDGLPDNNVRGIIADKNGNLWISTKEGLCKFTPPSFKNGKAVFRNYNAGDGLPCNSFGRRCKLGADGTLYFICREGVVAFKPEDLKDNSFIPPVVITGFSINNKSIGLNDSTGILKSPIDETKKIKLSYRQNDFSFSFAALNYLHPEKNQYVYMLEGYDNEWRYPYAAIPFASYTNMDPGEYTFRVRASNNDGVWNDEGTSIRLVITPPYWQTWWFRLLCALVGVMILYAIYYNRMQKIRDIRRIRNKIASDLHDDLGATLSSISIMSELVNQQVKDQSPQASSLLEKIGSSSRNMIESVNDMVWAINPQNDSFENIIKRMRTFASEILAPKDIAFHFDFDKNLVQSKLKMDMRRNFYLIFKEAVNNTAKYSGAANTYVMIWNRENNLKMTIRDDGSGFEMNTVKAGNGLINMQQRAELMKARFNLESIPGKGTIVELEFKNE